MITSGMPINMYSCSAPNAPADAYDCPIRAAIRPITTKTTPPMRCEPDMETSLYVYCVSDYKSSLVQTQGDFPIPTVAERKVLKGNCRKQEVAE